MGENHFTRSRRGRNILSTLERHLELAALVLNGSSEWWASPAAVDPSPVDSGLCSQTRLRELTVGSLGEAHLKLSDQDHRQH